MRRNQRQTPGNPYAPIRLFLRRSVPILLLFSACDIRLWNHGSGSEDVPRESYRLDDTKTIVSSGLNRTFHIHMPSRTPGLPVVIALHGGGETGVIFKGYSRFDDAADSLGFIVVYPEAIKPYGWSEAPLLLDEDGTVDDIRFILDLLSKLEEDLQIDPSRVYATGFSAGGFLSYALAALLPERIAAVAPVAASMTPSVAETLSGRDLIPALIIHGTDDSAVLWEGSVGPAFPYLSQEEALGRLLQNNACGEVPDIAYLPRVYEDVRVRWEKYSDPEDVPVVQRVIIEGGDHYYPIMLFDAPGRILGFFDSLMK